MRHSLFALWLAFLFALALPTLAKAQIYVDQDATGAGDGTSWADAYTDLQTAIDNASGSSELWIAEGIYTPGSEGDSFTITGAKDGIELYGGFDGTETSRDQRAPEEHRTILSGDIAGDDTDPDGDGIIENAADIAGDENAHHVLLLDGTSGGTLTPSTVLDGFTVTAGDADGSFPEDIGGGLLCDGEGAGNECSPAIANVLFTGNRASLEGGAIYNKGFKEGAASPRIADAQFSGNAAGDNGGALVNKGFSGGASNSTITNTTFSNNTAGDDGGAVYNSSASPTMINVGFVDNAADRSGGALRIFGGAPSITNAVFAGNAAALDGGAIDNEGVPSQSSSLTITNATFVDNTADQRGGAIVNLGGPVSPEPNPTAKAILTNTILWGNSAATGAEMYGIGSTATQTLSHTIVQGGAGSIVNEREASTTYLDESGTAVPFANSTNLDADPRLVDAANPAGPDGVFATRDDGTAIEAGSPAIEGGDTGALPSDAADLDDDGDTRELLPVDLTGAARLQDSDRDGTATVDIGAYEVSPQVDIALAGGGFGGLDRTFRATPGEANQPIGLFRLAPTQGGVDLTEVSVTPDNPGVRGVDRISVWISGDDRFDPSGDTELASLDLDPRADLPSPLTLGGFTETLPAEARTLFVAVTLTGGAAGEVTGYLADQTALALDGGAITEVNGNEQSGFSNLPLSGEGSTLPVELARFNGEVTDGGVRLSWRTTSEDNNAGFQVQRRAGRGSWSDVQFVEGAGTTSDPQRYRFTDRNVPYSADSLSYRLEQVDADGTVSQTEPVTVIRRGPSGVELLGTTPNPARQHATIRYAIPESVARNGGGLTLQVYDVMGRQVRSIRIDGTAGRHTQRVDVADLASGVYFLRLQSPGRMHVQKMTVLN
jgi:predicted outer membrane repeat protein